MREWKALKGLRGNFLVGQSDRQFADELRIASEHHSLTPEKIEIQVLLQSRDLTRQPLWKADVIGVHTSNEFPSA